jgi:hypothetical protein
MKLKQCRDYRWRSTSDSHEAREMNRVTHGRRQLGAATIYFNDRFHYGK